MPDIDGHDSEAIAVASAGQGRRPAIADLMPDDNRQGRDQICRDPKRPMERRLATAKSHRHGRPSTGRTGHSMFPKPSWKHGVTFAVEVRPNGANGVSEGAVGSDARSPIQEAFKSNCPLRCVDESMELRT